MLDLLTISKFHARARIPTTIDQTLIGVACEMSSAIAGLGYSFYMARKMQRQSGNSEENQALPTVKAIKVLARPAAYTFTESALRNALYLWLVSRMISLGESYGTA